MQIYCRILQDPSLTPLVLNRCPVSIYGQLSKEKKKNKQKNKRIVHLQFESVFVFI